VADRSIAKGDWPMLSYLSSNGDETVFDNPFEYDIQRSNRHWFEPPMLVS
jgi:cytochrome P450